MTKMNRRDAEDDHRARLCAKHQPQLGGEFEVLRLGL
jgi:hypothetical protein